MTNKLPVTLWKEIKVKVNVCKRFFIFSFSFKVVLLYSFLPSIIQREPRKKVGFTAKGTVKEKDQTEKIEKLLHTQY